MSRFSRDKGNRYENEIVNALQDMGLDAERVPLSGAAGGSYTGDLTCPVLGEDKKLEAKRRASGFKTLYGWMGDNYGIVIRDDRCPSLVVIRLEDFAKLARGT